jgi:plastocyanin
LTAGYPQPSPARGDHAKRVGAAGADVPALGARRLPHAPRVRAAAHGRRADAPAVIRTRAGHAQKGMRHTILAALLGAALLAGCGGDGDAGGAANQNTNAAPTAAPTNTIRIEDFEFKPARATVTAGRRIFVPNDDAAPHTLTERPAGGKPLFDTGTLRGKQTGDFEAPPPGSYAIYCVIHPFMKGEVEVVAP